MKKFFILPIVLLLSSMTVFGDDVQTALERRFRFVVRHGEAPDYYYSVRRGGYEGAYDVNGREIIAPNKYTFIFRHGKAPDYYYSVERGEYGGVCDVNGREIIAPNKYTDVHRHGEAPDYYFSVKRGEYEGVCDVNGREIIAPNKYTDVYRSGIAPEYYYVAEIGSQKFYLDINGCKHSSREEAEKESSFASSGQSRSSSSCSSSSSSPKESSSSSVGTITYPCPLCNGSGYVYTPMGMMVCYSCRGTGKMVIHIDNDAVAEAAISNSNNNSNYNGSSYTPSTVAQPSSSDSMARWETYYRENYSRWENQARSIYNSISNFSRQNSNGSATGYANHNDYGSNLASMKTSYASAQREMRNLRMEAQGKGISIPQSPWETNNIVTY